MLKTKSGIFLFNIIPSYRPGMSKVFDHGFYDLACTPSLAQRTKQNTLYTSLEGIAGESLSDLDLLYVMATDGTNAFAKINWVDPGTFNATDGVAPTFTQNIGFTGNLTSMYLKTGWIPSVNGVNYTLDECSAFCYINNETTEGARFAFLVRGNSGGGLNGQLLLGPKILASGNNKHSFSLHSSAPNAGSNVSSIGFFHIYRVADNDFRIYKDGSQVGTPFSTASDSLSDKELYLLTGNFNGSLSGNAYCDCQMGIFGLGASLTGQESALYTAWNTYFTSL